ncbi:MBL fold metallo-hydrolase [Paraferrimonas sp. SM1919]|uniref:MBL fold metallo-hydrolase n=1 Tax=Paraferrimonas sp. SM1919 TaxID=2662263 RepID=UPI0013D4C987|nr:MBL fold metallo-hydrolase [Paraferrimonas sp. SM1919]
MRIIILLLCVMLSACSSNQVTVINSKVLPASPKTDDKQRYKNLFSGDQQYPKNCTDNCYPNTPAIKCRAKQENCRFVAQQTMPQLDTPFSVRWLGHASFYIKAGQQSFLFDPVKEQFDWPVNWAFKLTEGFNRQPGNWPSQAEIDALDGVMYSHLHYDHFHKGDINDIGNQARYFVPMGTSEHFDNGGYQIFDMSWYSHYQIADTKIHFVPAHHFNSRIEVPYLYEDHNKVLWGGWIIEQQGKKLFFAGDTGYSPHFKNIHKRYGDMDICLIPIASYHHEQYSKWYRYVHLTPEDSLQAATELNCKVMIPFGYGNNSWKMGDHSSHSALFRLMHTKTMYPNVPLYILNEGEQVKF